MIRITISINIAITKTDPSIKTGKDKNKRKFLNSNQSKDTNPKGIPCFECVNKGKPADDDIKIIN